MVKRDVFFEYEVCVDDSPRTRVTDLTTFLKSRGEFQNLSLVQIVSALNSLEERTEDGLIVPKEILGCSVDYPGRIVSRYPLKKRTIRIVGEMGYSISDIGE